MTLNAQAQRLLTAGVADVAGVRATHLAAHAARLPEVPGAVLAVHPTLAAPGQLAGLLRRGDRSGFVVEDMIDVDQFTRSRDWGSPTCRCTSWPTQPGAMSCATRAPTRH